MTPLSKKPVTAHAQSAQEQALITVLDKLRSIMKEYELSRAQLAQVLRTSINSLNGWLDKGKQAPACLDLTLDLLQQSPQARRIAGIHRATSGMTPRGRPFKRGNPYRFKRKR